MMKPWFDDPAEIERLNAAGGELSVRARLAKLFNICGEWPPADWAGPPPNSGERTALHDYIARSPTLLADLEDWGVEVPRALREQALQTRHLRVVAVDGRALA